MADFSASTEDDIVRNHIDPLLDEADRSDATQGQDGTAAPTATPEPTVAPAGTQPAVSGSPAPNTATQPPATQPGARADGAQVLQDGSLKLSTGEVIKAGAPRRLYENLQTVTAENTTLKQTVAQHENQLRIAGEVMRRVRDEIGPDYDRQIAALQGQVEAYKNASTLPNQLQLNSEETEFGLKMMAAYKANPIATLQHLLAQAKAAGHNIEGIGANVDTAAITAMMDARLAPLTQDREAQQREQQVWEDSGRQTQAFLSKFPDAEVHAEHIAALMNGDPNLSVEGAYYELKLAATRRGLDWSKPLADQLRQSAQPTPAPIVTQQPLPNGRANAHANAMEQQQPYRGDAEFSDIIRDSMREAGLKI